MSALAVALPIEWEQACPGTLSPRAELSQRCRACGKCAAADQLALIEAAAFVRPDPQPLRLVRN